MMPLHQLEHPKTSVIPDRLFRILESCQGSNGDRRFPPTEIFNEGWMLRLVLDAFQCLKIKNHPLTFRDEKAQWFSEGRLLSPFRPKPKKEIPGNEKDILGEGYTCADGVIGHFAIRRGTKAGIELTEKSRQFLVVEAKLNSPLSAGIRHALKYNQAARNIACMAAMMQKRGVSFRDLPSVGFFVLAPKEKLMLRVDTYLAKSTIVNAVESRLAIYEKAQRYDQNLRTWKKIFDDLVDYMTIQALSWEDVIGQISSTDSGRGSMLKDFYQACRLHAGLEEAMT